MIERLNGLFYGANGVGKTRLALSFPSPLWINLEDDNVTGRKLGLDAGRDIRIGMWSELEHLASDPAGFARERNAPDFESILVDSVTMAEFILLEKLCGDAGRQATQAEYRLRTDILRGWIKTMRKLPYNVFFTAQEQDFSVDEKSGLRLPPRPSLGGKAVKTLLCLPDEVYRLVYRGGLYYAVTREVDEWPAKSRHELPPEIENPSYERIIALIKGS